MALIHAYGLACQLVLMWSESWICLRLRLCLSKVWYHYEALATRAEVVHLVKSLAYIPLPTEEKSRRVSPEGANWSQLNARNAYLG